MIGADLFYLRFGDVETVRRGPFDLVVHVTLRLADDGRIHLFANDQDLGMWASLEDLREWCQRAANR